MPEAASRAAKMHQIGAGRWLPLLAETRKKFADISHSAVKKVLNSKTLDGPPGALAVIGAVAISKPRSNCIAPTPSMARAIPADRNQAAKAPTPAARITMK